MGKSAALLLVLVFLTASCIIVAKPVSGVSAVENSGVEKAPMPSPDSGYGAAVVNGVIYIFGPTDYAYNPSTDTWTTIAPMLTLRNSFAIAACGNKIYVIGGMEGNGLTCSVNEVYDPSTNTWATEASMPTSRMEMQADTVNGKIYVMGGRTAQAYSTVNITEIYNPTTNSWTLGASMLYSVVTAASAVTDNNIYVIGGQDEFYHNMNVAFNQIYNLGTNSWSLGAPIPAATWDAGAGATTGEMAPERIYVFGNSIGWGVGSNQTYVYDPITNSWTSGAPMPYACSGPVVAVVNDVLYMIGGGQYGIALTTNEQYIPIGYGETSSTPSPSHIASSPSPSPSPSSTVTPPNTAPPPFPTATVAAVSGAIAVVVVGADLLIYFKKRQKVSEDDG